MPRVCLVPVGDVMVLPLEFVFANAQIWSVWEETVSTSKTLDVPPGGTRKTLRDVRVRSKVEKIAVTSLSVCLSWTNLLDSVLP